MTKNTYNQRDKWSSKLDFILTCVGYSVGLGNVWRFPYLCYKNGGGAFLVPYLLTVIFCGLPIACLEFSVGQYVGIGGVPFWEVCPVFKGIAITIVLVNAMISFYFIFVTAMAMFYATASLSKELAWMSCDNIWNTPNCYDTMWNVTGNISTYMGNNTFEEGNINTISENATLTSPTEEYMVYNVLNLSKGANDIGSVNWKLWLCLLTSWIMVYILTIQGVKSLGKAVYFTSTFPYVMLTTLFIRSLFLPGSLDGIAYFLVPKWEKLLEPEVWFNGVLQLFYSLGMGLGCFITMSSYNKFNSNCLRDAAIATFANSATSLYAGLTVFTVLGFMANDLGISIDNVIQAGPGFTFIAYPRAMSTLPFPQIWSLCFFLMLIFLGISSQVVHFETVMSFILDQYPVLRTSWRRMIVALVIVSVFLIIGTIFTTQGGMYVFLLMDMYCTPFGIISVAILECVIFSWIYGLDKVSENIHEMVGVYPNIFLKLCWKYISPSFLLGILAINFIRSGEFSYRGYIYSEPIKALGWCIAMGTIIPIPTYAAYKLLSSCFCTSESVDMKNNRRHNLKEKILMCFKCSDKFYKQLHTRIPKSKDVATINSASQHTEVEKNPLKDEAGTFV